MSIPVRFLAYTIPGDPIPKARPRVTFRGRKAWARTPKRTLEAEARVRAVVVTRSGLVRHDGPVVLAVRFLRRTRRRVDLDNLLKLVLDALNDTLWDDDDQVMIILAEKRLGCQRPRTELVVGLVSPETPHTTLEQIARRCFDILHMNRAATRLGKRE